MKSCRVQKAQQKKKGVKEVKTKTSKPRGKAIQAIQELTLNDISPILTLNKSLQEEDDGTVNEYVMQNAQFLAKHKLQRINSAIDAIKEKWPKATPLEVWVAFDMSGCCSDDLLLKLDEKDFKERVESELTRRLNPNSSHSANGGVSQPSTDGEVGQDDDNDDSEDDKADEEFTISFVPQPKKVNQPAKHRRFSKKNPICNEPIPPAPKGISEEEWRSWSDIHRRSYQAGMRDPNTFLYRNCPVGVQRKNGPWSDEEKRAFIKRLREIRGDRDTIDGKWGIFSLGIPGRVGYQCSNFYRLLIANGEISDSRYIIGADGKLHHTSHFHPERTQNGQNGPTQSKKKSTSSNGGSSSSSSSYSMKTFSIKSVNSLKFVHYDQERDDSDENSGASAENANGDGANGTDNEPNRIISRYKQWVLQNPLPDAVDQITSEIMKVPTISPDGYVLDYNTWQSVLKDKSENPFTRNPISKKDLVVLTIDNIDQYRDQIINL